MKQKSSLNVQLLVGVCACLVGFSDISAQDSKTTGVGKLHFVDSVKRDDLMGVTSVEVSSDGKFLYASAYIAATINVFKRDAKSGRLKHVQSITDFASLRGATGVRLSPDGRYAAAGAFGSRTCVLYRRDPKDGKLALADVARDGQNRVHGLGFALDAAFSPDSRFVYVIDGNGSVTAFRISMEGKLQFIEANTGRDACFSNVRGIVVHPVGKTVLVTASNADALVVLDRDEKSGKTSVRQIIRNQEGGVHGLKGAMGLALSPDRRFVYTSAGRFRGSGAVGVYRFNDDGNLSLVQEIVNDEDELRNFFGGNEIAVSPDGQNVYAVASRSNSLACFERDSKTGKLKVVEIVVDEEGEIAAAAGIGISPDGRFVYIAAESSQKVGIFRRDTESK